MSGIARTVKKAFKKSPILTTIVAAAAIWFTAGVASAYFSAASPGLAGSMSASASSMWTTATTGSFVSAAEVATTNAAATAAASQGAMAAATATEATSVAGAAEGINLSLAGATEGAAAAVPGTAGIDLTLAGAAPTNALGAASAGTAGAAGSGGGIVKGAMGWMSKNPIPTMILGQAGVGAYQGRLEEKERQREDEYRRSRGLMGYDYGGGYGGIVNTAARPVQQPVEPGVRQPSTRPQQVAAPQTRPIERKNLPKLNQQGLVAPRVI